MPAGRFVFAYMISFATICSGLLGWQWIPDVLPVHWDATGNPDSFAKKGWLTAFAGAWIGLALTTLLLLAAKLSHRRVFRLTDDSSEPALREQEAVDQWVTQGTSASFAVIFSIASAQLTFLTWVERAHGMVVVILLATMFAAILVTGLAYQFARRAHRSAAIAWSDGAAGDDSHWVAGLLYVNRHDRATIVPKRFGTGWTLNLGRPTILLCVTSGVFLVIAGVLFALMESSSG